MDILEQLRGTTVYSNAGRFISKKEKFDKLVNSEEFKERFNLKHGNGKRTKNKRKKKK